MNFDHSDFFLLIHVEMASLESKKTSGNSKTEEHQQHPNVHVHLYMCMFQYGVALYSSVRTTVFTFQCLLFFFNFCLGRII